MTIRKHASNVKPFLHFLITLFTILALFVAEGSTDGEGDPDITITTVDECDIKNTATLRFKIFDLISEFENRDLSGIPYAYDVYTLSERCQDFQSENGNAPLITDIFTSDGADKSLHYFSFSITSICSETDDAREIVRKNYTVDDMTAVAIGDCDDDRLIIRFNIDDVELGMDGGMLEISVTLVEPCTNDIENGCSIQNGRSTVFTWNRNFPSNLPTITIELGGDVIGGGSPWFPNNSSCCTF